MPLSDYFLDKKLEQLLYGYLLLLDCILFCVYTYSIIFVLVETRKESTVNTK